MPTRTPPMEAVKVFLRWISAMLRVYFKPGSGKARDAILKVCYQLSTKPFNAEGAE